jgi:glutamate racemase
MNKLPIGVFDSGIGGLTVLAAIQKALPAEDTIYLGDTARVPYGTKSAEVVTRYAINNARFLVDNGIKLLVIACNTASAVALGELQRQLEVPVIGVIEPGARKALEATKNKTIGVIGTEGTVASSSYQATLARLDPQVKVLARSCPLFVPLTEEGWENHPVAKTVAQEYLSDWSKQGIDTLILGCTHYPILKRTISKVISPKITLVDSASAIASTVAKTIDKLALTKESGSSPASHPSHQCYVTDVPKRFQQVGERFLGTRLEKVQQVDIIPTG